jgi:hypothetical protein
MIAARIYGGADKSWLWVVLYPIPFFRMMGKKYE